MKFLDSVLGLWVHPSRLDEARKAILNFGLLLGLVVLAVVLPSPPGTKGIAHYLPLHITLETLSIIVTALIFATIWSLRHNQLSTRIMWLGAGFLGVTLLDFSHMLSYEGMPQFITPSSAEKAIWFWEAARLLAGATLAAAMLWPERLSPSTRSPMTPMVLGVVLLVIGFHVLFLQFPHLLPRTFIEGQGLTSVKLLLETGAIALNLLAAALALYHLRSANAYPNAPGIFLAASTMAMSGYFFTLYASVTDVYNLMGHIYKIVADAILFSTIFVRIVKAPYQRLQASQQQLQSMLDALPDLLFEMDTAGRYIKVYSGRYGDLASEIAPLPGKTSDEVLPFDSSQTLKAALREAAEIGQSRGKTILVPIKQKEHWFELSIVRLPQAPNQSPLLLVLSRDISERLRTRDALSMFSQAVAQSPTPVLLANTSGEIEFVNAALVKLSGYSEQELLSSKPTTFLPSQHKPHFYHKAIDQLEQGKSWKGELNLESKDGKALVLSIFAYPIRNSNRSITHYLAHLEDITEKRLFIEQIKHLSDFDQLTGLPNPAYLRKQFDALRSQRSAMAILWLNLDSFKAINDTLGHDAGDALLREMAYRLRATLQNQDVLIRYSADNFAILAPNRRQLEAANLGQNLLGVISQPYAEQKTDIVMTASLGIALYPNDGASIQDLLKHAETAMSRIKKQGGNNYQFFEPEMQKRAQRVMQLGNALKLALQRNEFHLVYQPQLTLDSRQVIGVEVLLRWTSAQHGAISPAEFIPLAEASSQILPIGNWVLQTALKQLRTWLDKGLPRITMAVNISAIQFEQASFVEEILKALEQAKVPAELLELELTEAVALRNPIAAAERMKELASHGIRLSIDDFGTGYSSLSYLKRFTVHTVKIDQAFVQQLESDTGDQSIARAIVVLARNLSLKTLAEGVESAWQEQFLKEIGCDRVQGYYYSRPLTAAHFEAYMQAPKLEQQAQAKTYNLA